MKTYFCTASIAFLVVTLLVPSFAYLLSTDAYAVDGEITYTGTNTEITGDDSHSMGPFPIGFTFDFYGTDYTQVHGNINGTLNFIERYTRYSNVPLSTAQSGTNIANKTIYVFWDDLITNSKKVIYYATIGEESNRMFVMQWTNMYFYGTSIQMGTFQAILYEGTNEVQIQYRDLLGGNRALGNDATIGIRDDHTNYEQYSHNTASLTEGQAIRYTPDGLGGYDVDTDADYELVYLAPEGAPTSPTLVNPTNGTTGVTLAPTFEWLPVDSATTYTVLVSTVSSFSSTVVNQSGVTGTSYTLGSNLNTGTNYYWRVQAVNSNGSSLSSTRTFTTGTSNTAPSTPTDVTSDTFIGGGAVSSFTGKTLSATLADGDEAEQVRYRMQIATDSDFNDLVIDYRSPFGDEGTATYTYGEDGGTYLFGTATTTFESDDYYLRIRTEDDAAASSAWHTVSGVAFSVAADETAPGLSSISASPEPTSVIIEWVTDEAGSSLVEYGPSSTYVSSTTELNTLPRVTDHEITITGLRSCITYNFKVVSRDGSGNESESSNRTFTTKGCTGDAEVAAQTASVAAVATSTGAEIELISASKGIRIEVPAAYASTSAHFQLKKIDDSAVLASTTPPSGKTALEDHTYALHAITDNLMVITTFEQPIELTVQYTDSDTSAFTEDSLRLYRWDEDDSAWEELAGCIVNSTDNTVTCTTDHFSTFGLFGDENAESPEEEGEQPESEEDTTSSSGSGTRTPLSAQVAALLRNGNVEGAWDIATGYMHILQKEDARVTANLLSAYLLHLQSLLVTTQTAIANNTTVPDTTLIEHALSLRDLTLTMEGDDVRRLQLFLIKQNKGPQARELSRVGATGYFGTYTANALSEFQSAVGIAPVSGYYGHITRTYLNGTLGISLEPH